MEARNLSNITRLMHTTQVTPHFDKVEEKISVLSHTRLLHAKFDRCCMLLSGLEEITWALLCPSVKYFILNRHPPCALPTTILVTRKSACSAAMCLEYCPIVFSSYPACQPSGLMAFFMFIHFVLFPIVVLFISFLFFVFSVLFLKTVVVCPSYSPMFAHDKMLPSQHYLPLH